MHVVYAGPGRGSTEYHVATSIVERAQSMLPAQASAPHADNVCM